MVSHYNNEYLLNRMYVIINMFSASGVNFINTDSPVQNKEPTRGIQKGDNSHGKGTITLLQTYY